MRGLCGLCRIDFRAERPPSLGSLWRWGYSGLVTSYENVPRRALLPPSLQNAAQRGEAAMAGCRIPFAQGPSDSPLWLPQHRGLCRTQRDHGPYLPAAPPGPCSLGSPPHARLPAPQVVLHVLHLLPRGPGCIPQGSQRQRGPEPGSAVTNRLVLGRPW